MARSSGMLTVVAAVSLLAILASPAVSVAQSRAGKIRLAVGAGVFDYTYVASGGAHSHLKELSIGPSGQLRVGYLITDIVEAGVDFNLSYQRYKNSCCSSFDVILWRVGPYAEANIPINADSTIVIAPGVGVSYGQDLLGTREYDKFHASVAGTLKWFVAGNVSLDGALQATYFRAEDSAVHLDGFTIGPHIGISIWL